MKRKVLLFVLAGSLAACSSSTPGTSSSQSQSDGFSLQAQGAGRGGEARVSLKAEGGTAVTIISEINYDTHALSFKQCSVAAAGGKTLTVGQPSPGRVRAVLAGDLQPLAPGSEVLSCAFSVSSDAAVGTTDVKINGEMSDASFTNHAFSVGGTVQIGS
jgi:hypothetical protein